MNLKLGNKNNLTFIIRVMPKIFDEFASIFSTFPICSKLYSNLNSQTHLIYTNVACHNCSES